MKCLLIKTSCSSFLTHRIPVTPLGSSSPGEECGPALPTEQKDDYAIKVQGYNTDFRDILWQLIFSEPEVFKPLRGMTTHL